MTSDNWPSAQTEGPSTRFVCRACDATTGSVTLTRPGTPLPIPDTVRGVPPGVEWLDSALGFTSIVLEDFGSFALIGCAPETIRAYEKAISEGAAEELYALRHLANPYWCRTCEACFCRDHWTTDYRRTTTDNWYASCPKGHVRKLWGD
jgi:hypothetical protein